MQEVTTQTIPDDASVAYLASGCFWCVEAIYESVDGVYEAVSGYAGGTTENPTYKEVGSGTTGHAEVLAVYYDSKKVDFATLVDVYYASQDATTFGQKPDFGSAYRSIFFYSNAEEQAIIEAKKKAEQEKYDDPVVTEVLPFEVFYEAEPYHQDFEKRNPNQSYVRAVSIPRLKRFQAKMPEVLKKN
jgi:peptide-methionine (S)-S-oxide reductase